MNKVLVIFILISCFSSVTAQKVYTVDYSNQADIKVFVVKYKNQAELKKIFR